MESQVTRVAVVAAWTLACLVAGLLWITGASVQPGGDDPVVLGMASCMVVGCVGSVWFGVLLVALVLYALVRR